MVCLPGVSMQLTLRKDAKLYKIHSDWPDALHVTFRVPLLSRIAEGTHLFVSRLLHQPLTTREDH